MKTVLFTMRKGSGEKAIIGKTEVLMPSVPEIIAALTEAEAVEPTDEGVERLSTNEGNFVIDAVRALTFTRYRSHFDLDSEGNVFAKSGYAMPETFAALAAPTVSGTGQTIKLQKELRDLFAKYAEGLGKSARATDLIIACVKSAKAMETASDSVKAKLLPYIEGFADWVEENNIELDAVQVDYYEAVLSSMSVTEDDLLADL